MDWEKVDLTLEGHIGGDKHPNMPWELRRRQQEGDLYTHIFREHRIDGARVLQIVDDHELGREPVILRTEEQEWRRCASNGGDCCDGCSVQLHILNKTWFGLCDKCDSELNESLRQNPNLVFTFGGGHPFQEYRFDPMDEAANLIAMVA